MGWIDGPLIMYTTICLIAMIVMAVGAKILKIGVRDLIVSDDRCYFGFIPAIFIMLAGLM